MVQKNTVFVIGKKAWLESLHYPTRHLFAWWNGELYDRETGYNHLAHAICELMFLLEFDETHPEKDDRPERNVEVGK